MERAYIIHKGWASERLKEPELSETSASDDSLCKAIGPHKSLSCNGLQYTHQRSPGKNSKYLRIKKINNRPEQQKIISKPMNQFLYSYVHIVLTCSQEFMKITSFQI